jgi:hypothetical protein
MWMKEKWDAKNTRYGEEFFGHPTNGGNPTIRYPQNPCEGKRIKVSFVPIPQRALSL